MQFEAFTPYLVETHLKVEKVLDGDSLIVSNNFSNATKEIRLYGLDAPENKMNRKIYDDEKKARVPAALLVELGKRSTEFVLSIAPPGTSITLITEEKYFYDYYNRQLAYVILPDGNCLNESLIVQGFAKAYEEYFCTNLSKYQRLNFDAKQNSRGLYALVNQF